MGSFIALSIGSGSGSMRTTSGSGLSSNGISSSNLLGILGGLIILGSGGLLNSSLYCLNFNAVSISLDFVRASCTSARPRSAKYKASPSLLLFRLFTRLTNSSY